MKRRVLAVVGAQFGSEGKGLIVEKLAKEFTVHVRTGAPNAGHTYYIFNAAGVVGRHKVVARSVPVGACNPEAFLVIGAGGLVDINLLIEEVRELDSLGLQVSNRLMVDSRAMVVDPVRHHQFEGGTHGQAHQAIGSTGEGIGPARMARIARGTFRNPHPAWTVIAPVADYEDELATFGIKIGDTARELNAYYDVGASILLEGTQGSGLSLVHGPWPYVTSSDTNAAQLASDAGLAPHLLTDVMLVARTFPIRVAGHSGPLPAESSWENVGQPEERTTVTKKVRRVAHWHYGTVRRAVMLNRPTELAITFADYIDPDVRDLTAWEELSGEVVEWVNRVAETLVVPVTMIGTGPDSVVRCRVPAISPIAPIQSWPRRGEVFGDDWR